MQQRSAYRFAKIYERIDEVERIIPRIMIAGTGSGCGKTTVTCALLKALFDKGMQISAFKCGPDYIDPMFHERILGTPSTNLDSFFFSSNTLKWLLMKNAKERELCIIEGVMGYYDGSGFDSASASSYEIAKITGSPVILVINAKGASLSLLAVIRGFLTFLPENHICGIIFNQCSPSAYPLLERSVQEHFKGKIKPLGYLPPMPECSLESRHLGLITAAEITDFDDKVQKLAEQVCRTIDLEGICAMAQKAPVLSCEPVPICTFSEPVRIAAARDRAFCFYYHDNLDLLREMGAEIIPFSPMSDDRLPDDADGLYLGGGYPELYAEQLSANQTMLRSIRSALGNRIPFIAECGGFMYLTKSIGNYPMAGFFPDTCYNNRKLTRFGYIKMEAGSDNMLCRAGEEIPAHEFHYWDCTNSGADFTAYKLSGRNWQCGFADDHSYAGFPHFHFYSFPESAENFYQACLRYKEKRHA